MEEKWKPSCALLGSTRVSIMRNFAPSGMMATGASCSTKPRSATLPRSKARRVGLINRKSTRLNSSHVAISYAVFCLKKKKKLEQKALDKPAAVQERIVQ